MAVTVADEGTGIAAEWLPHLFRKFSRIHNEAGNAKSAVRVWALPSVRDRGDARGPHLGGERWAGPRGAVTFTIPAVEEPGAKQQPRPLGAPPARGSKKARSPHFGGGRRPASTAVHPGRPLAGGLHANSDPGPKRHSSSRRSKGPTWSCSTWCCPTPMEST